ncbi:ABC transporter permease [Corynebacterium sp. TAE3-ERU12]|uniref:ABC transporter permease n=1 Tax=Corynebacterium sp. TAE3-ERU12 TaxID=2849491 RepID=UPI001C443750|nr:ABC transporter permease [Corynebacterium sp. TAE3-ERU12]MBV7294444.1 ABC transporter permease [Corynebacterium sp. TAE3-ERU12]
MSKATPTVGAMELTMVHFTRNIRVMLRDSAVVVNTLVVPAMSFIVMRVLFGELMSTAQGVGTLDVLPLTVMLIINSQMISAQASAAYALRERQRGMPARIATTTGGITPMLLGRFLGDLARSIASGITVIIAAFILGMRIHTLSAGLWLAAVLIVGSLFGSAAAMFIASVGTTPESAMIATPLLMVVSFLNAGMVPAERFVAAVRPFAELNPLTFMVKAALAFDNTRTAEVLGITDGGHYALIASTTVLGLTAALIIGAMWFQRGGRRVMA